MPPPISPQLDSEAPLNPMYGRGTTSNYTTMFNSNHNEEESGDMSKEVVTTLDNESLNKYLDTPESKPTTLHKRDRLGSTEKSCLR